MRSPFLVPPAFVAQSDRGIEPAAAGICSLQQFLTLLTRFFFGDSGRFFDHALQFLNLVAQLVLAPGEFLLLLVERRPGFRRTTRHAAISALCQEKEYDQPNQAKHNQR